MKTNPKHLNVISALLIVGGVIGLFISIQKPIIIPPWLLGLFVIVGVSVHVYILAKPSSKSEMENSKDIDNL